MNISDLYRKVTSSHSQIFYRNEVLKNFAKFTEMQLQWSFFVSRKGDTSLLTQLENGQYCDCIQRTPLDDWFLNISGYNTTS